MLVATALLAAAGTVLAGVEDLCAGYASCFDCSQAVTSNDYVQFKYTACYDQLNIVPDHIECNPFTTDNTTYPNETLAAGTYKHYHWTLTTYHLINHDDGASITFEVIPEVGYPQMYTKAQILYGGLPMCQMFETTPGTEGAHSPTWPFPDKNTGAAAQGPEEEIATLERTNTPITETYQYPGSVFSEVTWGFNSSGYDSDKRPKVHTVTIPSVSYGGYFVSVYAADGYDARYSIAVKAVRNVDIVEEEPEYATAETPSALYGSSWWAGDTCSVHADQTTCERHCCTWDTGDDDETSSSRRRRMTDVGADVPLFKRRLQDAGASIDESVTSTAAADGACVASTADLVCVSEKESDSSSSDVPQPTVLVSFHTGSDANEQYSLYFVEMNDCASQMDRNGHEYCWEKGWFDDGGRLVDLVEEGGRFIEPIWQETCGRGNYETADGEYVCDPDWTEPGYCNFDGSGSYMGTPAETTWANAYDCIVWTPNGLARHGLPVAYTDYADADPEKTGQWLEIPTNFDGDVDELYASYNGFDSAYRLRGIVTSYDKRLAEYYQGLGEQNPPYTGMLKLPTNTWITSEIPIYNNVSYFFNVLKTKADGELDCYKGTSARTKFWRQTTLIPVEMIEIIAVVVAIALVALLVPFVFIKRKITAHLRDVYDSHKYQGYLKGVEERVLEERARRAKQRSAGDAEAKASGGGSGDGSGGAAVTKHEGDDHGGQKQKHKHSHKKSKKKDVPVSKHQILPVSPNSKEEAKADVDMTDKVDATL